MQEVKVLGVTWNPCSDSLGFDLSDLSVAADNLQPSKRNLVSLVGRIYNRLRFLARVTIKFKTLFQKLCKSKTGMGLRPTRRVIEGVEVSGS